MSGASFPASCTSGESSGSFRTGPADVTAKICRGVSAHNTAPVLNSSKYTSSLAVTM